MAMYPDEVALTGYREESVAADQDTVSAEARARSELVFEELFQSLGARCGLVSPWMIS